MAKVPTKTQINAQIHAGRRQKLRDRLRQNGLATFNECEVLEFALGFAIPRVDTNPAAHSLIQHFGSLPAVLAAAPTELATVYGIGERAANFLQFLHQFPTYLAHRQILHTKIQTPKQALDYLTPLLKTYSVEQFLLVCLDNADKVKSIKAMTDQELDMVHINLREMINYVSATRAAKVILAHNHLNDDAHPSLADMQLTRRLVMTFDNLGIVFLDHVIIANEQNYSFKLSGLLDLFKRENTHK